MALAHAPITGFLIGISVYYSSAAIRGHVVSQSSRTVLGWTATIKRLPILTFPLGTLGISIFDLGCALFIIIQMRKLERRWGSASFLAFVVTTAMISSFIINVCVVRGSSLSLPFEQLQVLSAAGSLMPLASLVTRFIMEVPSLDAWESFSFPLAIISKPLLTLSMLKLIVCPETELPMRTSRLRGSVIRADAGLYTRLVLTLLGVVFGLASGRQGPLAWFLGLFSRRVCRPVLRLLKPILNIVGGQSPTVELKPLKRAGNVRAATDGRYTVDNLVEGGYLNDDEAFGLWSSGGARHRRNARPMPQREGRNPTGNQQTTHRPVGGRVGDVEVDERVAQIMELGMGFSAEDIRHALSAAGGQVDVAVNVLVGA
ncbi:UBA/TS-N domain containing protein [Trypanosoma brucei equiperdum]|uniref:UBA/TS-N domain containing protein n=1 Tax=Trypanosoma brucei equiperdum TaxID=630700 RepID=A0A3L6LAN0_9TRYP|nr:UBA/TS-N domain containing protein [Trypanosoma brucei equiperdum]